MYREELIAKANNAEENLREQNDRVTGDSPKWNTAECNLEEVAVMYMQRVANIRKRLSCTVVDFRARAGKISDDGTGASMFRVTDSSH